MTQSLNLQNLSLDDQKNFRIDVFDDRGRLDPVQTNAANAEIFQESNTVRTGGAIDVAATATKRAASRAAVLARRK